MKILGRKIKSGFVGIMILLIIIVVFIFAFNFYKGTQSPKQDSDDVEIIIKEPVKSAVMTPESSFRNPVVQIRDYLNEQRKMLLLIVDANEYTIGEFWEWVLSYFGVFEYYSAIPEAFLRRVMFVLSLWRHNPLDDEEDELAPQKYPDNDWHSWRYRASLVPNTIEKLKFVINWFFDNMSVGLANKKRF